MSSSSVFEPGIRNDHIFLKTFSKPTVNKKNRAQPQGFRCEIEAYNFPVVGKQTASFGVTSFMPVRNQGKQSFALLSDLISGCSRPA